MEATVTAAEKVQALRRGVDFFTTGQISRLLGVAARSVSKWCDSGILPCYRIPLSHDRRILLVHLRAFLKEQGMPDPFPRPPQRLIVGPDCSIEDVTRVQSLLDLGLALDRKAERYIIAIDLATVGRGEGMAAARRLRIEFPASRLALIALACEDEAAALELGAAGFNTVLLAPVAPKTLREAIHAAMVEE